MKHIFSGTLILAHFTRYKPRFLRDLNDLKTTFKRPKTTLIQPKTNTHFKK